MQPLAPEAQAAGADIAQYGVSDLDGLRVIYFRCYIEAFDRDTKDLSMIEDGAYGRLLRHYFDKEKPLPLNSDSLARICRAITLEERAAIAAVLDRFFERAADGWHNKRADHEIKVSKVARENGAKGGRPITDTITDPITTDETESQTGTDTTEGGGEGGKSGQPNKPFNLLSSKPSSLTPLPPASRGGPEAVTGEAWAFYTSAYQTRYGVPPARNATVNGQMAQFLKRVGAEEAPAIAGWYVRSNEAFYVKKKHSVGQLLADAEKLRTEWATRQHGTEQEARQADKTAARGNVWTNLIEEFHGKPQ